MTNNFEWEGLASADLVVDARYTGQRNGNAGDDPLPRLVGVSNQGGFRILGSVDDPKLLVLTSSLSDPDWPDTLDAESGVFTYFGDNKKPGQELHDTRRWGNRLLRDAFSAAHLGGGFRRRVPPILIFSNAGEWRDVVFRGLAVPGVEGTSQVDDLVAVWKSNQGKRFQNYRAFFTILNLPAVRRAWIKDVQSGNPFSQNCPEVWRTWVERGVTIPLRAKRSIEIRSRIEQLPTSGLARQMLSRIRSYYEDDPFAFEFCACRLTRLLLGSDTGIEPTRRYRDGGRDAIGTFKIGAGGSSILVDFAIEAKCYAESNSVGVKAIARLISRLRHRQFGVIVTTSYLHSQAYKEIIEDAHPIIVISGGDIVNILVRHGIASKDALESWLVSGVAGNQKTI
jgi:hypothetical protein